MDTLCIEQQNLLNCPVCLERFQLPIETCKNGHGTCQNCRKELERCGVCRSEFSGIKNTLLNQMVESLTSKCQYNSQGCNITRSISDNHEKFCYFRKDKCPFCHVQVYLKKLHFHIMEFHGGANIPRCNLSFGFCLSLGRDFFFSKVDRVANYVIADALQTFFFVRVFCLKNQNVLFSVQCMSPNQQEAEKYIYNIKVDQGLISYEHFTFNGFCSPYIYDNFETRNQEGTKMFLLKSMVLNVESFTSFNFFIRINPFY